MVVGGFLINRLVEVWEAILSSMSVKSRRVVELVAMDMSAGGS